MRTSFTEFLDLEIYISVKGLTGTTFRPSTDKKMSVLFLENAFNLICFSPPIKIGFAANECEQIGVKHTHFIVGSITGPPADIE